jgi:hypothetical protein
VTAYLANRVVLEALSAICVRGRATADRSLPDPARPLLEGR